jgi:hypothetical protein
VRVLLLSARPDPARIATLARALADDDAVELVVAPAGTRALGADVDAVVVDGDPVGLGPELALALRHRVEAGLPLLALGCVPAPVTGRSNSCRPPAEATPTGAWSTT